MIHFQIQRTKLPTGSAAGRRSHVDTAAFLAAVALIAQILSACSSQSLPAARAFSSEVDAGSREENASKQETRAFSSEVDSGSRKENASKQEAGAPFRFNRNGKGSSVAAQYPDLNDPTPGAGVRENQVAQLKAELIQLRDNQERAATLQRTLMLAR
jgi:hypothetical protein